MIPEIRVFPRATKWTPDDDGVYIGDPPLFRPDKAIVKVSCSFTWDIPEAERLQRAWSTYYDDVRLGGPAFGDRDGPFVAGVFLKRGVTITTRGCPNRCPWCLVKTKFRELDQIEPGHIVQDDNILAAGRPHWRRVVDMLKKQRRNITFSGGLEARRLTSWHVEQLRSIPIGELWFACDSDGALPAARKARRKLHDLPIRKMRCFVLIGYKEDIAQAEARLVKVWNAGYLPFAQYYRSPESGAKIRVSKPWRKLIHDWSRPAIVFRRAKEGQI